MAATSTVTRAALSLQAHEDQCPGCGAVLPVADGPRHAYLGASSACWALFHRLAPPPDRQRTKRLIHDAYAAQHPGVPSRRAVQSVAIHLMDLCLLLEHDGESRRLEPVLGVMPRRRALDLHWLEPPMSRGSLTIVDALDANDDEERAVRIEQWAQQAWKAWAPHHATVRRWMDR